MTVVQKLLVVMATLLIGCCVSAKKATCAGPLKSTNITIPVAMPIEDFDQFVVGQNMPEVYFAIPNPPAFAPFINYNITVDKSNIKEGRYFLLVQGETSIPSCYRDNVSLQLDVGEDKARFILFPDAPSRTRLQVFWSSCPQKYVLGMRCTSTPFDVSIKKCPLAHVQLGIYVQQFTLEDLPLDDIMQDLRETNVPFGTIDFKWFFVFGETTLC